jgi:hypothetical protein
MASSKLKEGNLARIDLPDGTSVFCRVISDSQAAFYSARFPTSGEIDLELVYQSAVLFKIGVMDYAFKKHWPIVDYRPLEPDLKLPVRSFIKDPISGAFSIYSSLDGSIRASTYEECKDLEATAGWDPHHVESRLIDHFAGRPNIWVESLRAKP